MNIVLVAIVLALVCLLVIWLLPSWRALSVQLTSLFPNSPADAVLTPVQLPKKLRAGKQPPVHASARLHGSKRHTVLPHQARGR
ncbi:hypothetical protein [Polaromonas sp. A23]|uniref:hypothetical protein n=1 Tax=Polaromonas sp. A23 TaxID=1944133 RepID=UPI000987659E|nr:hypothetical protein [Polaromonas sp. A23]OOG42818.1 hypothetical protein B0B52_09090 [Polaromonas sp. A23]